MTIQRIQTWPMYRRGKGFPDAVLISLEALGDAHRVALGCDSHALHSTGRRSGCRSAEGLLGMVCGRREKAYGALGKNAKTSCHQHATWTLGMRAQTRLSGKA